MQEVDDADFMWHPAGSGTVTYGTASSINQYPTVGSDTHTFNLNGCLENDDTWAFTYDTPNRMMSADDGGTAVEFTYDPHNRQAQKSSGISKTRFVRRTTANRLMDRFRCTISTGREREPLPQRAKLLLRVAQSECMSKSNRMSFLLALASVVWGSLAYASEGSASAAEQPSLQTASIVDDSCHPTEGFSERFRIIWRLFGR